MSPEPAAAYTGQVVTFYSYKGGVGRTMALVNVGFIAALNGKRVLLIDWDLEAPGLLYYLRGLIDRTDFQNLAREAPGLLNMLADWQSRVADPEASASLATGFESEPFFRPYVSSIKLQEPEFGCLDYLGAGAEQVAGEDYVRALSQLSIDALYEDFAGGFLFEKLRGWAKQHYDLVLIDSRTGLADFSGICTMQMPDAVFLCFAMNRQNIDGTARVANAIRDKMQDAVTMHPVPMRLGRHEGSAEEADAIFYAVSRYMRAGLVLPRMGDSDFRALGIPSSDAIQFHEPLVPLLKGAATARAFDGLIAAYVDLTRRATGDAQIELPVLSQDTLDQAWARLSSRRVSFEYLEGVLPDAEPNRRAAELAELIETLYLELFEQQEPEAAYVLSVIGALAQAIDQSFEVEDDSILYYAHQRTLEMLRELHSRSQGEWRTELVDELFRHISAFDLSHLESGEVLSLYSDIDHLLDSVSPKSVMDWERQLLACRRAAAYALHYSNDSNESRRVIARLTQVHQQFLETLPPAPHDDQARTRAADVLWLRARGEMQEEEWGAARDLLIEAHQSLPFASIANLPIQGQRIDDQRLRFDIMMLLARAYTQLDETASAVEWWIAAVDHVPEPNIPRLIAEASIAVLAEGHRCSQLLQRLGHRIVTLNALRPRRRSVAVGSAAEELVSMLDVLSQLLRQSTPSAQVREAVQPLAEWVDAVYRGVYRLLGSSRANSRRAQALEAIGPAMKRFVAACGRWGIRMAVREESDGFSGPATSAADLPD